MKLFGKKPKNLLKSMIFTDSMVKFFSKNDDQVYLTLMDYCDSLVKISFIGVTHVLVDEHIVGMEIMEALFHWTGDSWVVNFKNDDGETILELSYENAVLNNRK